jgi:periplasmic divalent cation tolerance protein
MSTPPLRILLTTFPDAASAQSAATTLVTEHLAACVQILPGIVSTYAWQGAVESSSEVLVIIKSSASTAPAALDRLHALHPYEVPELVALEASAAEPYLHWLTSHCSP